MTAENNWSDPKKKTFLARPLPGIILGWIVGGLVGMIVIAFFEKLQVWVFGSSASILFFSNGSLRTFIFFGAVAAAFTVRSILMSRLLRKKKPFILPLITVILLGLSVESFFQYSEINRSGLLQRGGLLSPGEEMTLNQITQAHFYDKGRDSRLVLTDQFGRTATLRRTDSPDYQARIEQVKQLFTEEKVSVEKTLSPNLKKVGGSKPSDSSDHDLKRDNESTEHAEPSDDPPTEEELEEKWEKFQENAEKANEALDEIIENQEDIPDEFKSILDRS